MPRNAVILISAAVTATGCAADASSCEWVTLGRDFFALVGAIVAIYVAVRGLKVWRRQLRANTELEVARPLLRAAYRLRDAFKAARNPFVSLDEIHAADLRAEPSRSDSAAMWHRPLYSKRWDGVQKVIPDLDAALLEAEVLWGPSARQAAVDLLAVAYTLFFSIDDYLRVVEVEDWNRDEDLRAQEGHYRKLIQGRDDETQAALDAALHKLEDFLRPRFRRHLEL